ncbi:MAG: hypothetical protein HYV67_01995 [Candidatus Taylorbacteria bacterium]|nr:hypothetical protein [Candidatus Taylorbacteria bacterium]
MPATIRPLARQFEDRFLPETFKKLRPGDIFNTNAVEEHGLLGFNVTCLKLAEDQSEKGNAVMVWGSHAGTIVRLEPEDEVELQKSGSSEAMNAHLKQLRVARLEKLRRGN